MDRKPYSKKLLGIRAERVRDQIFGATDGTISTLAVLAGVAGATSDLFIIIIAGASAMLAEAVSMGFSSYSAAKAKEHILGKKRPRESPIREGIEFWLATMGGGFVPLVPFLLPVSHLGLSIALSAVFLFAIGANAARLVKRKFTWRRCCLLGVRSAAVGLIAAGITYAVGMGFASLAGGAFPVA